MICILEDDDDRIRRFRAAAAAVAPDVPVRIWRSAHAMIADLVNSLEHASLISLDHDLNRLPDEPDPGTGYDVASVGKGDGFLRCLQQTSRLTRSSFSRGACTARLDELVFTEHARCKHRG